jgi:hypothetical protein
MMGWWARRARFAGGRAPTTILSLAAVLSLAAMLAACAGPAAPRTTFPPFGSTPAPAGDATAATRQQVIDALAAAGLQAVEAVRPYRPPEGPLLAGAPRTVLQATLPDDPAHGYIVVYALPSAAEAQAAAADHAAYVASSPGRINFPSDARFVLRVVGSNVVFFHWSPASASDPRTQAIEDALATIGTGVPVPA